MIDDLNITGQGGNAASNRGGNAASNRGGNAASNKGGYAASNTGAKPVPPPAQKPVAKKHDTENSSVIDLRALDKTAAQGGARTGAVNLEEEAMIAAQNMMGPPEKFAIPTLVKEKFPDLIQLVKETESMNDEERDYWFQILPIMTEEQIKKFRDILLNEKRQLARLDQEYERELNRLNEKHMIEWKDFEAKEKRKVLTEAEQKVESEEKAAEEALMKRLLQA